MISRAKLRGKRKAENERKRTDDGIQVIQRYGA